MTATTEFGATMRVARPAPGVLAFYDGRIAGARLWSQQPNWLDDGAYALGACSYAVVADTEALVYDTHMSVDHARLIRQRLESEGVRSFRVVLSHWHADHVAGNAAFADCEIIANVLTRERLIEERDALENGSPPIRPLVLPSRTFDRQLALTVGSRSVELHAFDIHSRDGTVLVLPDAGILFPGDALEDPITYVTEPKRLEAHLADLDRLSRLPFRHILPNHGSLAVIEAGGYGRGLLDANCRYVEALLRWRPDPAGHGSDLRRFLGADVDAGHVNLFPPYEAVHRQNLERVLARGTATAA